jgi:hypothetical protein
MGRMADEEDGGGYLDFLLPQEDSAPGSQRSATLLVHEP